jgi:uncharacterized membrane protein
MELFYLVVLIGILAVGWFLLRKELRRVEKQLAQLTTRVFQLENERHAEGIAGEKITRMPPVSVPPKESAPFEANLEEPVGMPTAQPAFASSKAAVQISAPSPRFSERIRKYFGDEEWEALLGGSLLNKIGALVLVIGIALFLGYSFTHMAAAGRALTSLGVSLCLLGGGVFLERKPAYRVFARGLIGAGWAALYVTAYAIYAVPAARLIRNPYAGSFVLLLVAAGMIGHSLRYRVQAITAVAYFAAFAALGVTPSSFLALLGMVPLSASLLYLAYRFNWNAMATFGVIATYATSIGRGSSGASLLAAESLLLVYWLLFEAFDLIRVWRHAMGWGVEFLFPLNAIGFLGLSYEAWASVDPGHIWLACAFAAALYLASAIARGFLRPQSSFPSTDFATCMKAGSYEASVTLAAGLAGFAMAGRLVGVWLSAGFAIEAEILYLAGVFLDLALLRWLGSIGFVFSLARLAAHDANSEQVFSVADSKFIRSWTPVALFHAALFYINRLLRKPNVIYSSLAAALVAGVLAQELPGRFIGTGWLVFAAILFEIGLRKLQSEFRFQAYVLAAGGVIAGISFHLLRAWAHPWIPLACALVLVYALMLRRRFAPALPNTEQKLFDMAAGAATTALALLLVWRLAPEHYKGVFSCILALVLFELGAQRLPAVLARFSYITMAIASVIVIGEGSTHFSKPAPDYVWISCAGAALCLYFFSERAGKNQGLVQVPASSTALLFKLCALWILLPDVAVAPVWAALAVALFTLGLRRNLSHERWQGYLVMIAAILSAWAANFHAAAAIVVFACYLAQFLSPREGVHFSKGWLGYAEKYPRVFWSLLGAVSLTALLWRQFSSGLLTTVWGIEGLTILIAGFPLRERILRLEGLAILLVCILKLFLFDLRNLETVYRILSFIALGLILLGVSSIYTRFREQLKRYL